MKAKKSKNGFPKPRFRYVYGKPTDHSNLQNTWMTTRGIWEILAKDLQTLWECYSARKGTFTGDYTKP